MSSAAVDSAIKQSANDLAKELEVERVLKAFKLNPYDILDLPLSATESDVKKQYRKKSLLIHPDKYKHERGLEAFDFLKKAHDHLIDLDKRKDIDMIMTHARTQVLKTILGSGFSTNVADDDPRLANLSPPFEQQVRAKGREILVEDELARRRKTKLAYANEGAEKAKAEAEIASRKRKLEEQSKWEGRNTDPIALIPFQSCENVEMSASKVGGTFRTRPIRKRRRRTTCMSWDERGCVSLQIWGSGLLYFAYLYNFKVGSISMCCFYTPCCIPQIVSTSAQINLAPLLQYPYHLIWSDEPSIPLLTFSMPSNRVFEPSNKGMGTREYVIFRT